MDWIQLCTALAIIFGIYSYFVKVFENKKLQNQLKVQKADSEKKIAEITRVKEIENSKLYEAQKNYDYNLLVAESKENLLDNLLKIVISISSLNNINDYHKFVDEIASNMKATVRLIYEQDYSHDEAVEMQIDDLNLIFHSLDEKNHFKNIIKALISNITI